MILNAELAALLRCPACRAEVRADDVGLVSCLRGS
jgi:hypothetical protein